MSRKRYRYLLSQYRWHDQQMWREYISAASFKWHRSQRAWYERELMRMI